MTETLNIVHTLGFPIDFNGNLQRALFEAIHTSRYGAKVNFIVSKEVIEKRILLDSVPFKYRKNLNISFFTANPFIPMNIARKVGWRINNLISLPVEAYKVACNENISVMHVHAPTPVTKPFSMALAKKVIDAPILLDLHDPWSGSPFSRSPLDMLQTCMMKYAIDNADVVVVAHTSLIKLVKKINKDKRTTLIPNGVDTEVFRPMPKNLKLIKKLNLNPDNIIIGFSGHITEEKGLDILSYAARIVVRKYRNVRFLVIGDGPARLKYEMLVSKLGLSSFFTFTGFINADAVAEHLALTDIFVAPYRMLEFQKLMQIETPLKVVQYLAMGKPVVMSRISEQNVVSCSGGGLLTEPDHPRKLAEALMTLINDEEERKVMGKKARAYIERNLDWRLIAQNLLGIYRDLL